MSVDDLLMGAGICRYDKEDVFDTNTLCRRCRFLKKKIPKGTIFPIYYCNRFPKGLDSDYMNEPCKECFKKKCNGPWRMPEGRYTEEEFRWHIANGFGEYNGKD